MAPPGTPQALGPGRSTVQLYFKRIAFEVPLQRQIRSLETRGGNEGVKKYHYEYPVSQADGKRRFLLIALPIPALGPCFWSCKGFWSTARAFWSIAFGPWMLLVDPFVFY